MDYRNDLNKLNYNTIIYAHSRLDSTMFGSLKKILKNQMYTGDMVQSVQTKVSYKSKKKKTLPRSNWDIVKNTHEALVDRITFERVQNNVKRTN